MNEYVVGGDREVAWATLLVDESGSMGSRRMEVVQGITDYLKILDADPSTDWRVALFTFDCGLSRENLRFVGSGAPLDIVSLAEVYRPSGGTPLYDAVGGAVDRMELLVAAGQKNVFTIFTDGKENSSKEFSLEAVKDLIERKKNDGWLFVYLGVDVNEWDAEGNMIGTQVTNSVGNTSNYYASVGGEHYTGTAGYISSQAHSAINFVQSGSYEVPPDAIK